VVNVTNVAPPNNPPFWSNNLTDIPSVFSPTAKSLFNVTWQDDVSISTVFLESNFTGNAINYTMDPLADNVFNYSAVLPAGSFYWRSYANDSQGNWSSTPEWDFTIAKADPGLSLSAQPAGQRLMARRPM